eukprot:TRINITY_DN5_c0_g1_i13.p3 TRINITY_DN5_c0_g1~~TRINITY_DN5_c0_g1_i13.p3  ORF type:complete len:125 (-),score=26.42 TRINITY_DN5_c0_g1_i13:55-429(-)
MGLHKLDLSFNQFTGTVDFTQLPTGLQNLWLFNNRFNGTVDFSKLPTGLQRLNLYSNQFTGTADFTKLPTGLQTLDLHNNLLCGSMPLPVPCPSDLTIVSYAMCVGPADPTGGCPLGAFQCPAC